MPECCAPWRYGTPLASRNAVALFSCSFSFEKHHTPAPAKNFGCWENALYQNAKKRSSYLSYTRALLHPTTCFRHTRSPHTFFMHTLSARHMPQGFGAGSFSPAAPGHTVRNAHHYTIYTGLAPCSMMCLYRARVICHKKNYTAHAHTHLRGSNCEDYSTTANVGILPKPTEKTPASPPTIATGRMHYATDRMGSVCDRIQQTTRPFTIIWLAQLRLSHGATLVLLDSSLV